MSDERAERDVSAAVALWRRTDTPGLEYCAVREAGAPGIAGTVVMLLEERPLRVEYLVECDDRWRTRRVHIDLLDAERHVTMELLCDERRRWSRGGSRLEHLDGFEDADLSLTPSTNTLPIRRLNLAVGESRDVTAAWIRFPSLEVIPLPQRYTRRSERQYGYESRGGAFRAELEVDAAGMVLDYPPLWERVRR